MANSITFKEDVFKDVYNFIKKKYKLILLMILISFVGLVLIQLLIFTLPIPFKQHIVSQLKTITHTNSDIYNLFLLNLFSTGVIYFFLIKTQKIKFNWIALISTLLSGFIIFILSSLSSFFPYLGIITGFIFIYITIKLSFVELYIAFENNSILAAIKNSIEITKGKFWNILGMFFIGIFAMTPIIILYLFLFSKIKPSNLNKLSILSIITSLIVSIFLLYRILIVLSIYNLDKNNSKPTTEK